jgi:hypothetical protein
MLRSSTVVRLLALFSFLFSNGATKGQLPAPVGPSARQIPTEVAKAEPRVDQVIERAEAYFRQGKLNLDDNKRALARVDFDHAIDEILMSGLDVRASQRLQQFYYELVERIYREETKGAPPPPPSERIKNPIKSDDLYIPPIDPQSKAVLVPQERPSDDKNTVKYRARKGDTIAKIAAAQDLSADEVSRLNGIPANAKLQPGQEIKLPVIVTERGLLENEYVKSTREYKASLEKLLTLYEESEKRAEQRVIDTQKRVNDNLANERDVEQARAAAANAKLKVTEVRQQIATADKQIAQAVIEARQRQINEARDRERADELIGAKPAQAASGAMPIVIKWFNDYLHDPYSAHYVSWTKVRKGLHDGEPYWIVGVRIRAKNAFNAYRLSDYVFYIRRNHVVLYDAD